MDIIRTAGYGRVRGNRPLREKATLIQRFSSIIQEKPGWFYSGLFIDCGTSHDQLNALFDQCRDQKIDQLIIPSVKDLSLRNDKLYQTLEDLRTLNIEVRFLDDNLDTVGENGDEMLFVLSSFLKPPKPEKEVPAPYGMGDKDEAEIVKRIFTLFLSGHGRATIAAQLNDDHVQPPHSDLKKNYTSWTYCDIRRILDDPMYADEGIIDEQTWERSRAESQKRIASYGRRTATNSPLRELITCGVCGNHFTRRERGRSSIWLCKTYLRGSRVACPSRCIREDRLFAILKETVGDGSVDNITVWPDGRLRINTATEETEMTWR